MWDSTTIDGGQARLLRSRPRRRCLEAPRTRFQTVLDEHMAAALASGATLTVTAPGFADFEAASGMAAQAIWPILTEALSLAP